MTSFRGTQSAVFLSAHGFEEFAGIMSARFACNDGEFREVMEALWMNKMKPLILANSMCYWSKIGPIDRVAVIRAVRDKANANDLNSNIRNAVLALGGTEWLAR
jgi:hypothetical protein